MDNVGGVKSADQLGVTGDESNDASLTGTMGNPDAKLRETLQNPDQQPKSFGIDWSKVLFGSDPRLMRFVTRDGLAPEVDSNKAANASLPGVTNTDKAINLSEMNKTEMVESMTSKTDKKNESLADLGIQGLGDITDDQLSRLSDIGQKALLVLTQRSMMRQTPSFGSFGPSFGSFQQQPGVYGGQNQMMSGSNVMQNSYPIDYSLIQWYNSGQTAPAMQQGPGGMADFAWMQGRGGTQRMGGNVGGDLSAVGGGVLPPQQQGSKDKPKPPPPPPSTGPKF